MNGSPLIVIKLGGAVLLKDLSELWTQLHAIRRTGAHVVLVHGGGPQANTLALRLGHEPRIVEGRRITGDTDLDIVKWVIRGKLNVELAAAATAAGIPAAGISGADGAMVRVRRRPPWRIDGESVDFGHVGDVVSVDPALPRAMLQSGFVPIVACLGVDGVGAIYNVNADTVAVEIAVSLRAERIIFVVETGSVIDPRGRRTASLQAATIEDGVSRGWISGGMKVKCQTGAAALIRGVADVWITAANDIQVNHHGTRFEHD